MTTITQSDKDALRAEVLAMAIGPKLQKLEADLKAREHHSLDAQFRFLTNVRNALEQAEVVDYLPEVVRPGTDNGVKKAASNNPWSKVAWNKTEQGRLCKTLGVEKATALARAAGSSLGATAPNPDFN